MPTTEKKTAEQIPKVLEDLIKTWSASNGVEMYQEIVRIARAYAKIKIAEQRDICAESAKTKTVKIAESETMEFVDKDSIRNAKEPNL